MSGLAAWNSSYHEDITSDIVTNGETKLKTVVERAADKIYEERIEEEYAKREGGA